jgi:hypothetical protein
LGWVDEPGKCHACGACTPPERDAIVHPRQEVVQDLDALERRLKALRASETVVEMRVELDSRCLGLPMDIVHAWHARAWMQALDLVHEYRRHDPHGRSEEGDDCLATGLEILRPVFLAEGAQHVRLALADPELLAKVNAQFAVYGKILGPVAPNVVDGIWHLDGATVPDISGWLASRGIKHTMRKDGTAKVYEMAKESLKKKIVRSLRCEQTADGSWSTRLETLDKFSAKDFLQSVLTAGPDRNRATFRREA